MLRALRADFRSSALLKMAASRAANSRASVSWSSESESVVYMDIDDSMSQRGQPDLTQSLDDRAPGTSVSMRPRLLPPSPKPARVILSRRAFKMAGPSASSLTPSLLGLCIWGISLVGVFWTPSVRVFRIHSDSLFAPAVAGRARPMLMGCRSPAIRAMWAIATRSGGRFRQKAFMGVAYGGGWAWE